MFNRTILFSLLFFVNFCGGAMSDPRTAVNQWKRAIEIEEDLLRISHDRVVRLEKGAVEEDLQTISDRIDAIVAFENDPRVLALVAHDMLGRGGDVETRIVNEVSETAFTAAIVRISEIKTGKALEVLLDFAESQNLDGANSLDVKSAIDVLKRSLNP